MSNKRRELQRYRETRIRVKARFARLGKKPLSNGGRAYTVLLCDIYHARTGEFLADHLWLNFTKSFQKLQLKPGDVVALNGRVAEYWRMGYQGRKPGQKRRKPSTDYKLIRPAKVEKLVGVNCD